MKLNNMQCQALYDYTSEYPEDLKFNAGQVIDILGVENTDWYIGQYIDATGYRSIGIFPKNYVQLSEETEGNEINMKDIVNNTEDISKNNKDEHTKSDRGEKSDTLSSKESESKKSVKKSFREILDSFNTPKEEDIPSTTNRHSYIQKPRMCLSNIYINNTRQTETHNTENLQKDISSNVPEQNILQLGSLKNRILALKNIKFDNQESLEANASNNNLTLEPILEENTKKHNIAPKNISSEISSNSSHSFKPNKNAPSHEPRDPKQEKNEKDNLINDEKKTSETISSKNNDSSIEEELARRAAIRERMAKMSYAGMNMHMVLGISKQESTYTGPKSSPKRTSFSHNEDKSQITTPVFSVPIVPSSPTKQPNRNYQLDNFSKSDIQNTNKEITIQNNSSEFVKHSLSHLHLSTPLKYHDTVSVSENDISLKDDNEDLEKSAIYYTPVPIVEPFSVFLSKNSKNNSPILSNKTISPILIGQSPENFEPSKLPQRPLKDPPSIPEHPYSTHSSELFNNIDLSTQKQSTPCRPAKPLFISKSSLTSKCTSPILSQHDNRLSHTSNISSELGFISEEASKSQLSCSDFKDKLEYTYILEEKQFCIDEDKLEENKNSRNDVYRNDISSSVVYEKNANDDISPISLTSSYVIQNIADNNKVKKDINNNMFAQTDERPASNLQYRYSKYPGSPLQQNYSEEYFSFCSPASDISETDKKSNKYQVSAEKPYIHNQLSINQLRGAHYLIDQRNINYDPFNQVEYIAHNIDLEKDTLWWTLPNALPSIFQNRKDILLKFFESSHLLKDGNTIITKEIRILFHDYSETHILVTFNKKNPENANLKQIHQPSPIKPNQNQLEIAYEKFGTQIANLASLHFGITVGDGSPFAFVQDIISNIPDALPSTGVRAYGALIYRNRANASTEQRDEIKTGDIVSFRNAKFQGHKGSLYTKYNISVGNPDHAAVIMEWDGTKRKIKVWEQGRISKKVIQSSFKIGDLKSGEICIWRVMSKSWVSWDS
ncbi:hypothetical protein PNEG_03587 [Pneumocystis murina B123]|uniref:SH3 domain-containing protein n=1 Tax=Pneumocystis murina (strain B123) TaxID=1069680 RepID=M7P2P0_PNEMU|nr:hypothetical protein PNEG_03587 [Pneumocystis murina B123]EMR08150.1 hypothetical protein PNEG_03587 [Pneumocystis murina B123]